MSSASRNSGKKKKNTSKSAASPAEREHFQFETEEDWQVVQDSNAAAAAKKQQPAKKLNANIKPAASTSSKAHIEEIHSDDSDYNDSGIKPTEKKATQPQGKPKLSGTKLTPTQRRSLQSKNKNPHTGVKKEETEKGQKKGNKVEVEDGEESEQDDDELINEEEEGRSDLESGSEGDAEEGDDGDAGLADWEKEVDQPKKKQQAAPAASNKKSASSSSSRLPSFKSCLTFLSIFIVCFALVYIRFQDSSLWHGLDADDIDMTSRPPGEQDDYYKILQVERTASLKEIKASYRKLVLITHPDKNKECTDCVMKFQRVQQAYNVLSNTEKRAMYDSVELTYDELPSETTELTSANFDSLVTQADSVWVIQIYTDWHKSAIRFAQSWEEAASRYGQLVSFGRIHAHRERELTKRFPIKHNIIPSVIIYANGEFSTARTFYDSSQIVLSKLAKFVHEQFPNTVESVENDVKSIQAFMNGISAGGDGEEQATVLFIPDFAKNAAQARKLPPPSRSNPMTARAQQQLLQSQLERINEPSLTYKAVARKYQYAVKFGQVAQLQDTKAWKTWIAQVAKTFKLSPPTTLPALLYRESTDATPKWLTGDLNKEKLLKHMDSIQKRMVVSMNSHSFARHCAGSGGSSGSGGSAASGSSSGKPSSSTICILGLSCSPLKSSKLSWDTFLSEARTIRKQQAFSKLPIQFAKVDVEKQVDMKPLCESLPKKRKDGKEELKRVVLLDGAMYHYSASEHPNQSFDAWLNHVVKQDGTVDSLPLPSIPVVHIPADVLPLTLPHFGLVYIPLRTLYMTLILLALVLGAPIISKHLVTFVCILFALSIVVPGFEMIKEVYEKMA